MAENEVNVISHLLSVESEASELVNNAKSEADKIIVEARSKADSEFRQKFEKIAEKLESEHKDRLNQISQKNMAPVAHF